jgi:hypothetical protein
MKNDDPHPVQSPWGAIAAFFLVQCFGFVTLQGFRMFVNLALRGSDSLSNFDAEGVDRLLLPLWGLAWVYTFLLFQADVFRRISDYVRERGVSCFLPALKAPSEMAKLVVAVLFAAAYALFLFDRYPFPAKPISTGMSALFAGFGWAASAVIASAMRKGGARNATAQDGGIAGYLFGFLVGALFFAVPYYFEPGLFYFNGMLGLGVMTMIACRILFKGAKAREMSTASQGGDA